MKLKHFLSIFGVTLALASMAGAAQYPARPLRLIVPLAAGGPSDTVARVVGQALSQRAGQPVVIDNKPGADGTVAAETVLRASPDGYTLFWSGTGAMLGVPLMSQNPPYDPLAFTPVSLMGRFSLFLYSHPGIPARTVPELVEHARAWPGKLAFATSAFGDFIAAMQFMKAAGINMTRVPYKGAAQALPALIAGDVQLAVAPAFPGLAYVQEGRLRALAVFLPQRSPAAPEVPAMAEAGIAAVSVPWTGVYGPPKMPGHLAEWLSRELNAVVRQPALRTQLDRLAFQAEGSSPRALAAFLRDELEKSGQIVREYRMTRE
jgi:tripartite-type tricarboxylate transporter receptor subunit TctC